MIAYLKGSVLKVDLTGRLVLDVNGVGYEVFMPVSSTELCIKGQSIELWTYSHVREDTFSLYGFLTEKEKDVFVTMIGINGLGPKTALGILSQCSSTDLMQWIESEDIKSLCELPKVGKKMAGQMILSLKGKWPQLKVVAKTDALSKTTSDQVAIALSKLGFKSSEVKEALSQLNITKDTDVKEGIKQALSFLHQA